MDLAMDIELEERNRQMSICKTEECNITIIGKYLFVNMYCKPAHKLTHVYL